MKDLVVLTADMNAHFALKGALGRPEALGIRPIGFEFIVHTNRDGRARTNGPELLALKRRGFSHALPVPDFEGSGTQLPDGISLEAELDQRLSAQWKEIGRQVHSHVVRIGCGDGAFIRLGEQLIDWFPR